jgi:2'-5' RNA ligase
MKLTELKSLENKKGTYAALYVSEEAHDTIMQYIRDNDIPHKTNPKEERKHVTLIYSRNYCPDMVAQPAYVHYANVSGVDVFNTQDGKRALVLLLDAPTVVARHKELMAAHPATYDHPEYRPHITLSYDIGDFDETSLLPFKPTIELKDEYVEDLKLDWQNS